MAQSGDDGRRLPSLKEGDVFVGRYRIEKQLGQGLYGQTFHVKNVKYGQSLVLKVFYPGVFEDADSAERFRREFDQARGTKDLGVARYIDQGEWREGNTRYSVFEYLNGASLRSVIEDLRSQGKPISGQDAVQIVLRVLETLKSVHTNNLSHRNIKPENILIVTRGRASEKVQWDVRISDFALTLTPVDWLTEVSSDKRPYMAPELLGFAGQVGPRSDLYAAGALLYELVVGNVPDADPPAPSSIKSALPKAFDNIIELSMASNPADRYNSAQQMIDALTEVLPQMPLESDAPPRSRMAPLLIGLGLAGLLAVVSFILTREPVSTGQEMGPGYWAALRAKVKAEPDFLTDTEAQIAEKQKAAPKGMVYVPGGSFIRGAMKGEPNAAADEPRETVVSMPGYYIDMYEFPNEPGKAPTTALNWDQAENSCNKLGKRLCTAEEWERACKGEESLIYSYGDDYNPSLCAEPPASGNGLIGASPECKSSYGVHDLSGGVSEWVNAALAAAPDRRVVKGGIRGRETVGTRCAAVTDLDMKASSPALGFRCCR